MSGVSVALSQATNIHHWAPFYVFRWLGYWTGIANESGKGYAFWSGFGSCITEFTIFGGIWIAYRKHNCHLHRCWRISHHDITDADGHTIKVCHKHHPTRPKRISLQHIEKAWAEHKARHAIPDPTSSTMEGHLDVTFNVGSRSEGGAGAPEEVVQPVDSA